MASRYCIVAQPITDPPPLLKLLRGRLITSHLSLGAASDTDALQLGNLSSLTLAASGEDAAWGEPLGLE
jgi:hypothetical protein